MRVLAKPNHETPDTPRFLETLRGHASFFDAGEIVVGRAPGRLDVMGGIADYSGSLVLQMPIAEATFAATQRIDDRRIEIVSLAQDGGEARRFTLSLDALLVMNYEQAREHFRGHRDTAWAAYVAGVPLVLHREKSVPIARGLRILIDSRVPEGKGVSSSAAIEVATMSALASLLGVSLEPAELGALCQKVENLVVGAPCGIMDQMASACGQKDRLLALLCQPAEIQGYVAIPPGLAVWGIDSGIRHAVSGADYGTVRTAAFMGLRILNDAVGEERWKYLANWYDITLEGHLPIEMLGSDFLARYGGTSDTITRVEPSRLYPVFHATMHPVGEHARIRLFAQLLKHPVLDESISQQLGDAMFASHASYSACGLGSDGTDRLVELVRELGPARGLYGAKITGGGSGGTVAILGRADAGGAVREVFERYRDETGRVPYLFTGSSPGAAAWGVMRVAV